MRRNSKSALVGVLVGGALAGPGYALASHGTAPHAAAPRVTATYSCKATVLGSPHTFASPSRMAGKTPVTVAPGAVVKMTGFQAQVTIPSAIVALFEKSGMTWISGSSVTLDLNASDAKTATVNAGKGLAIPQTSLPKPAANVTIALPTTAKTVGSWTPVAAGTMTFTDGIIKTALNDNVGKTVPVSCTPKPAVTLSKTTVS